MNDLISRRAAIEGILDLPDCPNGYSDTYDKARIVSVLEEVSAADVVEVVKCKDCKYYVRGVTYVGGGTFDGCDLLEGQDGGYPRWGEDEFCSRGERREDSTASNSTTDGDNSTTKKNVNTTEV